MNMPLVSIIVPIYNVEKYLEQCINSLVNQTYKKIEIVLIDDGSTDSSGQISDKYAGIDKRIKVVHKLNGGLSSARKVGVSEVSGEFAMFVDGDDWIDENTVQECINCIEKNQDIQCVLFAYKKEYPQKSIPVQVMDKSRVFDKRQAEDKIYRRLFGLSSEELNHPERMHNIESCCMKLYRTDLIKKGEFFETKVVGSSEDALFNMYALYEMGEACYINKFFYHYRKLPKSLTNSYRPRLIEQWGKLFDIMENIIEEKQLGRKYECALKNRIALSILGIGINELSNSQVGVWGHVKNIRNYLKSSKYSNAVRQIKISEMSIQWKFFMVACKCKLSVSVYAMLIVMTYLKRKM